MIKPLVIIGVDSETNMLTVQGPDDKMLTISVLSDAIKTMATATVSSIVDPVTQKGIEK